MAFLTFYELTDEELKQLSETSAAKTPSVGSDEKNEPTAENVRKVADATTSETTTAAEAPKVADTATSETTTAAEAPKVADTGKPETTSAAEAPNVADAARANLLDFMLSSLLTDIKREIASMAGIKVPKDLGEILASSVEEITQKSVANYYWPQSSTIISESPKEKCEKRRSDFALVEFVLKNVISTCNSVVRKHAGIYFPQEIVSIMLASIPEGLYEVVYKYYFDA